MTLMAPTKATLRAACMILAGLTTLPAARTFAQVDTQPIGWRTDGSGEYPNAAPTLHWSDMHNVVWTTPIPQKSNATPVIVKDRVFVCAEPATILGIDCESGKVLWEQGNSYEDILPADEWNRISERLRDSSAQVNQIHQLENQIFNLKAMAKLKPDDKTRGQIAQLTSQLEKLTSALGDAANYIAPATHVELGYASPTPISDGTAVYVAFGNGVAASYDLDGKRRWIRVVERPSCPHGYTSSPVIIDGKLLVHFDHLTALDPATGKTLWQAKSESRFGTTCRARIGGKPVAITPSGDMIDTSNGRILASELGDVTFNTPIVHNDVVYFIEQVATAVRLPASPDSGGKPQMLWKIELPKDRYTASPLYHQGKVYGVTQKGLLSVIDAQTGKVVQQQKYEVGGRVSPSLTLAGGMIFLGDESGKMLLLNPAQDLSVASENLLEPHRASPVFHGEHMYLRGQKSLFCIGGIWLPPSTGETRASPIF